MPPRSVGERELRVLFFFRNLPYVRFYDPVIRELLRRGHAVHLLLEHPAYEPQEKAWLEEMERQPGFSWSVTHALRQDPWLPIARPLRTSSDYLRFLRPGFSRAPYLVGRAEGRAPARLVRALRHRPLRASVVLGPLGRLLGLLEAAVPPNAAVEQELRARRPDVFVVSPHLMPGSRHSELVRVARLIGVRTCLSIPSWDNLSSKQVLHASADSVLVWNETQRREAINLHGVPSERIEITGAQGFDRWFERQPTPRDAFLPRIGLPPGRPYVLYVGGSLFPGELTEAQFARRWVEALRGATDPALSGISIVLRPHPKRLREWQEVSFAGLENVVVWPPQHAEMPVGEQAQADYFDSIHHSAAVVGLNTSAMIEAVIIGRVVHAILVPEFSSSQLGVFHFDYLRHVLRVATTLDEHLAQLALVVAGDIGDFPERRRRFLADFVRPAGIDVPAAKVFVDAVERAAEGPPPPVAREAAHVLAVRRVLAQARRAALARREAGRLQGTST